MDMTTLERANELVGKIARLKHQLDDVAKIKEGAPMRLSVSVTAGNFNCQLFTEEELAEASSLLGIHEGALQVRLTLLETELAAL